jgi:hypothetical protein
MTVPWWERYPARWDHEQQALRNGGIPFEIDPAAFAAGKLVVHLHVDHSGRSIKLVATYPASFPYFAPMVVAPGLELPRHQTPGSKQLCLLDRGGDRWMPASDTLASLVLEKLPEVFASQPGEPNIEPIVEAREGEPITIYLQPELSSFVGFPAFDLGATEARGTLRIGMENFRPLRATVLEVINTSGRPVAFSDARQYVSYPAQQIAQGTVGAPA